VLKRIFVPKREDVAKAWRGLHNEDLRNLCPSPKIIRAIRSRGMGWARHVARMEEMINTTFWLENLNGRDYSKT